MWINVTKTYLPDREKFFGYVNKIFDSVILTNNGPLVQELEQKLCNYLWVENLLLISNGTIALQIMFQTLGLKNNVITTPFSFVATTSSLMWEWLNPVFCDIDKKHLTIDENQVEKYIDSNTSAILGTHVYGNICAVEELEEIGKKHNVKILFDAAHCFWVKHKGKSILNYGDASILSFHCTKLFHTIEWWAIIFKKREDYETAKKMINFWITGPEQIEMVGINGKMNEFQAAMWLSILDDIENNISKRKIICDNYDSQLRKEFLSITWRNEMNRNYAYYPIVFETEQQLINAVKLLNENNISPRRYFKPSLNELPFLSSHQEMPISEDISRRVLCLPLFETLDTINQELIFNIINNV